MADPASNPVHDALHGALESSGDFGHAVLGVRLRRLTLWHLRALHLIRHPDVYDAPEGRLERNSFGALFLGALVCAMEPGGRRVGDRMKRLTAPGFLGRRRVRRAFKAFMADPLGELGAWENYWRDHYRIPLLGKTKGAETMRNQPWLVLQVELRMRLGMSDREAWLREPGLAVWEILCAREVEGGRPPMVTEEEISARREAGYPV